MLASLLEVFSWLACRCRGRAALELEVIALRHQLAVLRRQRPGRARLFAIDRLLWVWLYRVRPRCLDLMVLGETGDCGPIGRGFGSIGAGAHGLDVRQSIAKFVN